MPLIQLAHAEMLVEGLDHPEGITYAPDGYIYAGGEDGQVYRVDLAAGSAHQFAQTGGLNLGLAADAAANLYVCNAGKQVVNRVTPDGTVSVYSRGTAARAMQTPNYPAFDAAGFLYVADSGAWKADNGCIWSIAPGGETALLDTESCQFPNGCAVSPDGSYLYIAISLNHPRVVRFPIRAGQKVGAVEEVVSLPGTVPDGLAFCADGSVLVACYRPDVIFRVTPAGDVGVVMEDYEGTLLGAPTNVCFGGENLTSLLWANLGRWHLGINRQTGLQGAPLFYPSL
ncbi:MAG: SMP-30/gluconolactonase/LRE family protein [Litorilinea sp.]